jgi:hypothetical protein
VYTFVQHLLMEQGCARAQRRTEHAGLYMDTVVADVRTKRKAGAMEPKKKKEQAKAEPELPSGSAGGAGDSSGPDGEDSVDDGEDSVEDDEAAAPLRRNGPKLSGQIAKLVLRVSIDWRSFPFGLPVEGRWVDIRTMDGVVGTFFLQQVLHPTAEWTAAPPCGQTLGTGAGGGGGGGSGSAPAPKKKRRRRKKQQLSKKKGRLQREAKKLRLKKKACDGVCLVVMSGSGLRTVVPLAPDILWRPGVRPATATVSDVDLADRSRVPPAPRPYRAIWKCQCSVAGSDAACGKYTALAPTCSGHAASIYGVKLAVSRIPKAGMGLFATRELRGACPENGNQDRYVVPYLGRCYLKEDFKQFPAGFTDNYMLTLPGGAVVVDAEHAQCYAGKVNQAPRKHMVNCLFVRTSPFVEDLESLIWVMVLPGKVIAPGEELYVEYNPEDPEMRQGLVPDAEYFSEEPYAP